MIIRKSKNGVKKGRKRRKPIALEFMGKIRIEFDPSRKAAWTYIIAIKPTSPDREIPFEEE